MRSAGTASQFRSPRVIQGYNGIATVDGKHQVIVDAQAFGEGHEAKHTPEVFESIGRQFHLLDQELNIYDEIVLTADTGFNGETSSKSVDRWGTTRTRKYSGGADFHFDEDGTLICPNGTPMRQAARRSRRRSSTPYVHAGKGDAGWEYYGYAEHCGTCPLNSKCIRAKKRQIRRIKALDSANTAPTGMRRMIERFDSERGRRFHNTGTGTAERVFGNIRHNLRLDRLSFRGKKEVATRWKLTDGCRRSSISFEQFELILHPSTANIFFPIRPSV